MYRGFQQDYRVLYRPRTAYEPDKVTVKRLARDKAETVNALRDFANHPPIAPNN
jgi:hypothetical protein